MESNRLRISGEYVEILDGSIPAPLLDYISILLGFTEKFGTKYFVEPFSEDGIVFCGAPFLFEMGIGGRDKRSIMIYWHLGDPRGEVSYGNRRSSSRNPS